MVLALAASLCFLGQSAPAEKTVAGTTKDLMVVRRVVLRGSNESIGAELARIAIRNHGAHLGNLDAATMSKRLTWFRGAYPEVLERAKGVQRVYGGRGWDYTSLPYDMDVAPGCSVVFYPGRAVSNGHTMMSRNYDFPKASYAAITHQREPANARSMTGDPYVIEMHPDHGYAALYICAYDLLQGTIDGVNEKGVCVALLADDMSKSKKRGTANVGLGEIDLTRYVLDKASSARQARRLLARVPYYATFVPCHYMIADASGDSFVFEVDAANRHHVIDGGGKPQIVTNHALFEYAGKNLPAGNSFDRYRRLQAELAQRPRRISPAEVKQINSCVAVPSSVRIAGTLWHAVYDLTSRSLEVSFCLSRPDETAERRSPYLRFRLGK